MSQLGEAGRKRRRIQLEKGDDIQRWKKSHKKFLRKNSADLLGKIRPIILERGESVRKEDAAWLKGGHEKN